PQTAVLSGPGGLEPASVVVAEGGRLVFVQPGAALASGALYSMALNGLVDQAGQALPYAEIRFRTAPAAGGGSDRGAAPPAPPPPRGAAGGRAGEPGPVAASQRTAVTPASATRLT